MDPVRKTYKGNVGFQNSINYPKVQIVVTWYGVT